MVLLTMGEEASYGIGRAVGDPRLTVVNPRDGSLRTGQDVRITGEQIVGVEPASGGDVPAAAQVVDAAGRYLVPGFADMHAHPLGAGDQSGSFDLMLAHGITGFRQMRVGADAEGPRSRNADARGRAPAAGHARHRADPVQRRFRGRCAATVREQHDLGADFIKAALVTSEIFYQAQQECGRLGIPILGHLPNGIEA